MALNKTSLSSAPTPDEGATKERRRYTPVALIAAIISLLLLTIYLATGGSNTPPSPLPKPPVQAVSASLVEPKTLGMA